MRRLIISIVLTLLLTVWAHRLYLTEAGFDGKLFIIIITLAYMVCYKLVQYLARFKIIENNSRIDIVFVVCVIAFMFVPVLHINRDEISVQENRTLAKYVPLIDDDSGAINYNFGKDFESWFNDRFFGRKQFIKTSKKIDMYINNEIKNFDAMAGKENWLFTKRWNSEDMFRNKYLFDDEDLSKLKHRLESLQMWLAKRHIKLYLMLVPDKERVYGEYYPDGYTKVNEQAKIEQVYEFVGKYTDIPVVYPIKALEKAKKDYVLFYKTGTHWNHRGAYVAYLEMMKMLKKDYPELRVLKESDFNIAPQFSADEDVANALGLDAKSTFPKEDMTYDVFELKKPTTTVVHEFVNKKLKIETFDYVSSNPANKLKAIFYADSQFLRMSWYVAESFKKMQHIYVGYGRDFDIPYMAEDIEAFAPDILVVETGERFLNRLMKLEMPEQQ